jgi:hypothetical protein
MTFSYHAAIDAVLPATLENPEECGHPVAWSAILLERLAPGKGRATATDGHRLHRATFEDPDADRIPSEGFLLARVEADASLAEALATKPVEGKFPDVDAALPKNPKPFFTVEREELIGAVKRLVKSLRIKGPSNASLDAVTFDAQEWPSASRDTLRRDDIRLNAKAPLCACLHRTVNFGEAEGTLRLDGVFKGCARSYSPAYLLEAIAALPPVDTLVLRAEEGDTEGHEGVFLSVGAVTCYLMPVRVAK